MSIQHSSILVGKRVKNFWIAFSRNRAAVLGLILLLFLTLAAIWAPIMAPYDPFKVSTDIMVPPGSPAHSLGTDDLGRDIFSGVLYGGRVSLVIGLSAGLFAAVLGALIGAVAGFLGGAIDDLLMRLSDTLYTIPRIVLAICMVALFGSSISLIIVVIAVLSWPAAARLIRSQILSLKEREFVLGLKAIGESRVRIVFIELLPNAMAPLVVWTSLQIGQAILVEAGLSFLGLGDPNTISWGTMLHNAQQFITIWWMSLFPGLFILITVLALNLIGDGLNEAFNPKRSA